MNFYDKHIMPRLVHFVCAQQPALQQRQKVVPIARGRVLEIGLGSGLNLPLYDADQVDVVWALEPAAEMRRLAAPAIRRTPLTVGLIDALAEVRRVLKPNGSLQFCEHGLSPDAGVAKWQHRLTPLWSVLGGGCHLDRPIPALLRGAGVDPGGIKSAYIRGFKPASYNFWGEARRAA